MRTAASSWRILSIRPFGFLQNYSREKLKKDFWAGLTVAVVALPQSMAYAVIAGVNPKYGIYAAIVPVIIAALLGSSKFLVSGSTNAIAMVVASSLASISVAGQLARDLPEEQKMSLLFFLAFLVGLIQVIMGLARLGGLVKLISHSVAVGFAAGAGFLIIFNQMENFFGLPTEAHFKFTETFSDLFFHLGAFNPLAVLFGLFTLLMIFLAHKISPQIPGAFLALAFSALAVWFLDLSGAVPLVGSIPNLAPPLSWPEFSLEYLRVLFAPALAIAILGLVEAMAIAQAIAVSSGEKIDARREFFAQGLANISAAFFSALPGSGSFTRSAVNYRSGARTRLAAIFSGLLVLFIVIVFAVWAEYVPIASLAGVLIAIVCSMAERKVWIFFRRASRTDQFVLFVTFLSTLFLNLETAVFLGLIISLALVLRKVSFLRFIESFEKNRI